MITYKDAIRRGMTTLMEDPAVVVYGIGVTDHTAVFGTLGFLAQRYPERVLDMPLSEDSLVGLGLGMALGGLRPINIHIRADFLLLAMNQLVNMVAPYTQFTQGVWVPLTIRVLVGRGWGQGWHHSKSMFSMLAHVPGLTVACPARPLDAERILLNAELNFGPTVIFEHRWLYWGEEAEDHTAVLHRHAELLGPEDLATDLRIVAVGRMVQEAVQAAQVLRESLHVKAGVVDMRYLSPLNRSALAMEAGINVPGGQKRCSNLLICDDDWTSYGVGAELYASLHEWAGYCDREIKIGRLGWKDMHVPTSLRGENQVYYGARAIVECAGDILGLSPIAVRQAVDSIVPISHNHPFKGPF